MILVDDVVSTGGTMTAVLNALKAMDVEVGGCYCSHGERKGEGFG